MRSSWRFDIPPAWGYLICALVVIPLVTHGVSTISRLQVWTQPLWLVMLVVPFVYVLRARSRCVLRGIAHYAGEQGGRRGGFDLHLFGAALTVGIALITQMGEQADYLRFMPGSARAANRARAGGGRAGRRARAGSSSACSRCWAARCWPTWRSATWCRSTARSTRTRCTWRPTSTCSPNYGWAVAATALFVVISQLKINVTNAYAGSLAWSNFFSRLTHSHPGRVVWVVFNTLIAFMLMEMNVFQALGDVLGLYSNIAIAWMMAVVADLVINKPLGLVAAGHRVQARPPVRHQPGRRRRDGAGLGAVDRRLPAARSAELAQAFSALIALGTALVVVAADRLGARAAATTSRASRKQPRLRRPQASKAHLRRLTGCVICEREYEADDMAHCPAYRGSICSLCCTLDARCDDLCKPHARLSAQWRAAAAPAAAAARSGRTSTPGSATSCC